MAHPTRKQRSEGRTQGKGKGSGAFFFLSFSSLLTFLTRSKQEKTRGSTRSKEERGWGAGGTVYRTAGRRAVWCSTRGLLVVLCSGQGAWVADPPRRPPRFFPKGPPLLIFTKFFTTLQFYPKDPPLLLFFNVHAEDLQAFPATDRLQLVPALLLLRLLIYSSGINSVSLFSCCNSLKLSTVYFELLISS